MRFSICTFNIAHGRGLVESNWQGGSLQERKKRLDQIVNVIADCDIAVLQEVDFRAPWSYFLLNQHQYLKKAAGFKHGMSLANHRFFPRAGISILSRFPLVDREVIRLPQYSRVEGFIGYRKDALACTVMLDDNSIKQFRIIGVHMDFRGRTVTVPATEKLISYTKQQKLFTVMAGDFNSTPLSFPNPRDNQPTALDMLRDCRKFKIPPNTPEPEDMTYPSDDPHCAIDWIMIPPPWVFKSRGVLDVTLSDHRPIKATIEPQE